MSKLYWDKMECPKCGGKREILRKITTAGKRANSYCTKCRRMAIVLAGAVPKEGGA